MPVFGQGEQVEFRAGPDFPWRRGHMLVQCAVTATDWPKSMPVTDDKTGAVWVIGDPVNIRKFDPEILHEDNVPEVLT